MGQLMNPAKLIINAEEDTAKGATVNKCYGDDSNTYGKQPDEKDVKQ
jgi:hypothetical protein